MERQQAWQSLADLARSRRMCRSFTDQPIDRRDLLDLVDVASRAPSAGKTQGLHILELTGPDRDRYWDITLSGERRASFAWPGLLRAPTLLIPFGDPEAYVRRYAEPDKAATGLGGGVEAWSTPYWLVDASMATMSLLLDAHDRGLGTLLFGMFGHEPAIREAFGVPNHLVAVGVVAIGYPDGADIPSGRSAQRPRRDAVDIVLTPDRLAAGGHNISR